MIVSKASCKQFSIRYLNYDETKIFRSNIIDEIVYEGNEPLLILKISNHEYKIRIGVIDFRLITTEKHNSHLILSKSSIGKSLDFNRTVKISEQEICNAKHDEYGINYFYYSNDKHIVHIESMNNISYCMTISNENKSTLYDFTKSNGIISFNLAE